jgi:hypothetical protein
VKRKTDPAPAGATERPVVVIPETVSKNASRSDMPLDTETGMAYMAAVRGKMIAAITSASFSSRSQSGRSRWSRRPARAITIAVAAYQAAA